MTRHVVDRSRWRWPTMAGLLFLALATGEIFIAWAQSAPIHASEYLLSLCVLALGGLLAVIGTAIVSRLSAWIGGDDSLAVLPVLLAIGVVIGASIWRRGGETQVQLTALLAYAGTVGLLAGSSRLERATVWQAALTVTVLGGFLALAGGGQSLLTVVALGLTGVLAVWVTQRAPRRAPLLLSLVLIAALSAVIAARALSAPPAVPALAPGDRKPNVVLIVLDTVRVDHVSAYGYARQTTPNLDAIAAEGARFTQFYANAPTTLPSHASLFTGLLPSEHGAHQEHEYLRGDVRTLAETLGAAGYRTAGWSCNPNLGHAHGMTRGFQEYTEVWRINVARDRLTGLWLWRRLIRDPSQHRDKGAAETTDRVLAWLDRSPAHVPFFLFINYLEAHGPYRPPREYVERLRSQNDVADPYRVPQPNYVHFHRGDVQLTPTDLAAHRLLYDAEIAYLDHHLGRLFDDLRRDGRMDNTILIVTSDHGENFGEHGLIGHQFSVHNTLLHIPLLIRYPPTWPAGVVIDDPAQVIDLFPTILTIAGVTTPDSRRGRLLTGAAAGLVPIVAQYFRPVKYIELFRRHGFPVPQFDRRLASLRQDSLTYIWSSDGRDELYSTQDQPQQRDLIASADPSQIGRLRGMTETLLEEATGDGEVAGSLDSTTREALRALGYVP